MAGWFMSHTLQNTTGMATESWMKVILGVPPMSMMQTETLLWNLRKTIGVGPTHQATSMMKMEI